MLFLLDSETKITHFPQPLTLFDYCERYKKIEVYIQNKSLGIELVFKEGYLLHYNLYNQGVNGFEGYKGTL